MVNKTLPKAGQMSMEANQEENGSWILEESDLGRLQQWTGEQQQAGKDLPCKSADVFSKSDLDLGCVI